MSEQMWALTGVVVGALLGGLAQIVAALVSERRRQRQWQREQQAEAYRRLVTLFLEGTRRWERRASEDPAPSVDSVGAVIQDTNVLAGVTLFGSEEARRSSDRLILRLVEFVAATPDKRPDTFDAAATEFGRFVKIARGDVGTVAEAPRVRRARRS